jgi:uncharacterized membrane protein required for colicin V production
MDRLSTSDFIDIALIACLLLAAVPGSWRGIVKETFISASLLLGLIVSSFWIDTWADQLVDWFDLSQDNASLIVAVAVPLLAVVFVGYVASVNAGIPPADVPGRLGGYVLGLLNAVVLASFIGSAIYQYFLRADEQRYVDDSHVARALVFDTDRIMLGVAAVALVLTFASVSVRRRRSAILSPGGSSRQGSSGYQIRRDKPLAPEAEKIETGPETPVDPLGQTMPIARVPDSSSALNRPATPASTWNVTTAEDIRAANVEVVRCVSCGERLNADDRFCPRCGRSLVR